MLKLEITEEEKKYISEYMNVEKYLNRDLTDEEYGKFEDELSDAMFYTTDEKCEATRETAKLARIYDDIYWRHKDK